MPDDLDQRLYADAARQPVVDAPPLAPMLARATRAGRPALASLAVAASVVLIGGASAVLLSSGGGGTSDSAGDSSGVRLRGLLQEDSRNQPNVVTVLVDTGSCTRNSAALTVRLTGETATAVYLRVGPSVDPSSGASVTPINDITEVGDPTAGVSATPIGGGLDGLTGGPSQSPPTGTALPSLSRSGQCVWQQIAGAKVHLAAPPGARKFYVDDQRMVVLDAQFPSGDDYLPDGYHAVVSDNAENSRLVAFARATNAAGDLVGIDYGAPESVRSGGTVIGHANVHGHRATLTETASERAITWTLDTGARVRLYSRGADPLSVARLTAAAGRVG